MPWCWPAARERRLAALGAVALLAASRDELPGGLRLLAAGDPPLARALGGLPARLEAGAALADALRGEGLVDAAGAEAVRAAGDRPQAVLRELAGRAAGEPAGALLLAWWPLWLGLALLGPSLVVVGVAEVLGGGPYQSFAHLFETARVIAGDGVPAAGVRLLGDLLAVLVLTALPAALLWRGLLAGRWFALLPMALAPSAWRAHLLARLIHHARTGSGDGLRAVAAWDAWRVLCWRPRRLAALRRTHGGDLAATLDALGLAPRGGDGRIDWDAAAAAARAAQEQHALATSAPLAAALVVAGLAGFALIGLGGRMMVGLWMMLEGPGGPAGLTDLGAGMLALMVGITALAALLQALVRAWQWLAGDATGWRLTARALATACQRGTDPAPAVAGLALTAPWPHAGRLERLAGRLRHGEPDLPAALVAERVVPPGSRATALAAGAAGRAAWVAWLEREGADPGALAAAGQRLRAQAFCLLVVLGLPLLFWFQGVWQSFRRTGLAIGGRSAPRPRGLLAQLVDHVPGWLRWLVDWLPLDAAAAGPLAPSAGPLAGVLAWLPAPDALLLLVGLLLLAVTVAAARGWLPWQRAARRLDLGAALLAVPGAHEERLAQVVGQARPAQRVAALIAAGRGDLAAVLRCAGWPVAGLAALASALERDRRRWRRQGAWALAAATVALSLLAGLVVAVTALTVFAVVIGWQAEMLTVLMRGAGS